MERNLIFTITGGPSDLSDEERELVESTKRYEANAVFEILGKNYCLISFSCSYDEYGRRQYNFKLRGLNT